MASLTDPKERTITYQTNLQRKRYLSWLLRWFVAKPYTCGPKKLISLPTHDQGAKPHRNVRALGKEGPQGSQSAYWCDDISCGGFYLVPS